MTRPRHEDALTQRLRADAPAWREQTQTHHLVHPHAVDPLPTPWRWVWPAVGVAAAAAVLLAITLLSGFVPMGHRHDAPPPRIASISMEQVLDQPAMAMQRPLMNQANQLADDLRSAAGSALGPLLAFTSPPPPQP